MNGRRITVTNPQKELDVGISKADLAEYYRKIAPLMLPHVKDRPILTLRFPEGFNGEKFLQRNIPTYFPRWLEAKCIEHTGGKTCYPIITDEAGIVYLGAQVAVLNVMPVRADMPYTPDKMIFDLDPSIPDVPLLRSAAYVLKGLLESLGFTPYIMTTGSRGYHIAVPLIRELDNEGVKKCASQIAETAARRDARLTTEVIKERRNDRVFIDINRVARMQTSVAPYAARAQRGLPIASPFAWDELPNIGPTSYTISNPPNKDAWQDFFAHTAPIQKVLNGQQ